MTDLTSTGPTLSAEGGPGNAASSLICWEKIWPRTDLLDLLGVTHPIIQAPMSGFSSPALVAAVSNAGALGSLGCATLATQAARNQVEEIRRASNRPFSLNFYASRHAH